MTLVEGLVVVGVWTATRIALDTWNLRRANALRLAEQADRKALDDYMAQRMRERMEGLVLAIVPGSNVAMLVRKDGINSRGGVA